MWFGLWWVYSGFWCGFHLSIVEVPFILGCSHAELQNPSCFSLSHGVRKQAQRRNMESGTCWKTVFFGVLAKHLLTMIDPTIITPRLWTVMNACVWSCSMPCLLCQCANTPGGLSCCVLCCGDSAYMGVLKAPQGAMFCFHHVCVHGIDFVCTCLHYYFASFRWKRQNNFGLWLNDTKCQM